MTYDDDFEEINPNDPDSIQIQMQQMFDDENSGIGIVDESVELLEHIDTLQVIPYFEGSLENTCNYPPGYIPSFPDSIYAKRIDMSVSTMRKTASFSQATPCFIGESVAAT